MTTIYSINDTAYYPVKIRGINVDSEGNITYRAELIRNGTTIAEITVDEETLNQVNDVPFGPPYRSYPASSGQLVNAAAVKRAFKNILQDAYWDQKHVDSKRFYEKINALTKE